MQGTVTDVQAQIAKLMGGDVDLVNLMDRIRNDLPSTMTIRQESVTIALGATTSTGTKPATGLDTSGQVRIGNITISGTAKALDDLSVYVDRLAAVPGIVDVLPASNIADATGVQYNLTLGLTDKLLSHRFDVSKNGGK